MRWRQIQQQSFTCLNTLADYLELTPCQRQQLLQKPYFPLNIPVRLARKIVKQTLEDPILRQFVPLQEETHQSADFSNDPIGDLAARQSCRLLHKYHGRVLIITSSACAMHCRFCFRKYFPYKTGTHDFCDEILYIKSHPDIDEVIFSGGDPLSLSNNSLQRLINALSEIPHIRRLRFHTRFPVGIPERIDRNLIRIMSQSPHQIYFVLHINHPLEIDTDLIEAIRPLQKQGVLTLSQTVLLKGVNDDEPVILALCNKLINAGIIPYYLHQLDHVQGSAHFEVPRNRGLQIMDYLQRNISGYGVPRFVYEMPGQSSKKLVENIV
jgi:EF-P beta-lysylation protein EpmB